jgi:hypothetical protein
MPIQKQPLPIAFAGGIESKIDSKQVPITQLLDLENATFIKQSTLAKRNGYAALGQAIEEGGALIEGAIGLAKRGTELLIFDSERAYSYRESSDGWASAGEVASVIVTDQPIARTGTNQTMPDHATNRGVTVAAWEDSRGGVYCSVVEAESGRILLAETELDADGISPRCVPCGTVLHIYWAQPSTSQLYVAVVNPSTPTATPAPLILTSDLNAANPVFDAVPARGLYDSIDPTVIAWAEASSGYRVGYVHPAGVLGSPVTGLPSVASWSDTLTGPIAVTTDHLSGAAIAVAWCDTQPRVRWLSPSALTTSTGTVALSATTGTWNRITLEVVGAAETGETLAWWAAELDDTRDDLNRIECGQVDDTGAVIVASTDRLLRGHGLVSRAFYDDGHIYAAVCHPVQFFPYVAVVRISADDFGGAAGKTTQTVARLLPGISSGLGTRKHLASAHDISTRQHALCLTYRIQLDSEDGDQFGEVGIKLVTLDYDHDASHQGAELGRGLYLAGACPMHYDGRRWAEAGFHCAPDTVDGVTLVAEGAAGAMAAGVYGYKFCYEEIDNQGEWHPGPTSIEHLVTVGASKKVNVTIPTYRLTTKRRVRIGVFRSEANDDAAYYRVTSLDPEETGDNGYVLNDSAADTVSFIDNLTDAVLITREPLYTNGGILSNDPTPMKGDVLVGGMSRLFATDPSDPQLIRYSKQLVADDTAVEWPVHLSQRVDPYGGRIVAIAIMDGAGYVFCETAIYVFGGPGPDADGGFTSQNAFTPCALVTSDVGCKAPKSICQTPNGIAFQSQKGIKLLGRDRQVVDIGAPVYAFNDQTVTRATLLPDRPQVVFLTDNGFTLLWDYERGQWSKFTNHEGIDALILGGVYHYLRNDSRVFEETTGVHVDDNSHIRMRIDTAWIKLTGYLQGWQRILWVYFLGTYKSPHALGIRYRLNYNEGWTARRELDVDSNYDPALYGEGPYGVGSYGGSGGDSTRYQRRLHLNKRCQSIQFRIEDIEETAQYGASFELSELLLIGGVLGPAFLPGASRTG